MLRSSKPCELLRQAVEIGYKDNPYHNAAHAADVVQTLGSMLLTEDFRAGLTPVELLAMLVAACCHDVGHPGASRMYARSGIRLCCARVALQGTLRSALHKLVDHARG